MKIDKSLEKAADEWYEKCPAPKSTWWDEGEKMNLTDSKETFIAGAKWQKQQMMDEWLKDREGCFWDGVEEGKKAMREQMLKDAVEVEVYRDGDVLVPDLDLRGQYNEGDKVKIVIVKED